MNLQNQLGAIIGFIILAISTFLYTTLRDKISFFEAAGVMFLVLVVYALFLSIFAWFYSKPVKMKKDYEDLHTRISLTVDTLIRKQQFIEQQTLNLMEEQAQNIWVITTKLENEIKDPGLRRTVEKNLHGGKHYTYFLPHPKHPYFREIEKNMEEYKRFGFYETYKTQIRFIRLPVDTQFLLEEVVIYNPEKPEMKDDPINGINGFTYYESRDDNSDRTLHMKIEGELLTFLCRQLRDFLQNKGLRFAAERIITEYKSELNDSQKVYLADLLDERSFPEDSRYDMFVASLANKSSAAEIEKILSEYKERK